MRAAFAAVELRAWFLVGVCFGVACALALASAMGCSSAAPSPVSGAASSGGGAPGTAAGDGSSRGDAGLSGATPTHDAGPGDAGSAPAPSSFTCPKGGTITAGLDTLIVGTQTRQFYVDLPSDNSHSMAVVFSWHGFGQLTSDFRNQVALDPNAIAGTPAVIVTPVDTGLLPPAGLDWDILSNDPNVDLPFFEAMVGCLEAQLHVDPARIYSFGFSAGAVFTNLLASQYPKLFAAIVTESGAWFNDKAEVALVTVPLPWSWPPLDAADHGNVLMTHGGANDVTVANIVSLENAAQAALPFLLANERTVVDCAHDQGHAIDPDVPNPLLMKYLFAHRLGEPPPYQAGTLSPDFPPSCSLNEP
jgi:predicted esterase